MPYLHHHPQNNKIRQQRRPPHLLQYPLLPSFLRPTAFPLRYQAIANPRTLIVRAAHGVGSVRYGDCDGV